MTHGKGQASVTRIPNPYSEQVFNGHMQALATLDTDACPFSFTMPDEGSDRAYSVARHYLAQAQGMYYANLYNAEFQFGNMEHEAAQL